MTDNLLTGNYDLFEQLKKFPDRIKKKKLNLLFSQTKY